MKVAFVSKGFANPRPGAQGAARDWYEWHSNLFSDEIQLIPCVLRESMSSRMLTGTPIDHVDWCMRSSKALRQMCSHDRFDLIHIHCYGGYVTLPPKNIPAIVTFHDEPGIKVIDNFSLPPLFPPTRILSSTTSLFRSLIRSKGIWVHALSSTILTQLTRLGIPTSRIRVIPNGIERRNIDPPGTTRENLVKVLDIPSDSKIALTVGSIEYRKGLHRLLETAELMEREGLNIHIVAVGRIGNILERIYAKKVFDFINQKNLSNVHVTGYVPLKILRSLQVLSDAYISASISEACNLALLEAALVGLPIVTTDVGAARDLFGEEAIIVPRYPKPIEMMSALSEAVNHGKKRYSCVKKFQWENVVRMLMEFYRDVLESA